MGYIARGVVYVVIGVLALLSAIGEGGETTDSKGALVKIFDQPFGVFLIVLLIIGLIGFVVWRFVQAIKDTDSHGKSAKGIAIRVGLMASAVSHALLALWAIKMLFHQEDKSSGGETALIASVGGQWLIGVAGFVIVGVGVAHIVKGWTARFERYMEIPSNRDMWAQPVCRFGLIARGVVWCLVGWFFINSALLAGSGEVKGMAEALASLREAPYGSWILGIVSAGLFAFGVYSVLEAIYRRIDVALN
ncbi:MAG: DUF1206 domain-containing protein [Moraxellaceae bacterium]|nr:MAG: DUF1206 domain-containing protein [Moraxellaceae bacterium]